MEMLFLTVLGMSGTAAAVIVLVLLARLLLRRAPKAFSYALWAVVLFRLLCPISIPSPWSLSPKLQVEPAEDGVFFGIGIDMYHREITVRMDMDPVPSAEETIVEETGRPAPSPFTIAGRVWLAGTALLLGYSAVSMLRLRRKLVGWVPLEGEKNVRLADHIPSPFVLGLFRPRIYLPSSLPESERDYILLHERTHIRRGDHIFRALAWLAVAVHWFNPLVWLAFHLAGKDMEMSCDEAVLRKIGRDVRADYSASLLRLSQGGRLPAGPLAFGDGNPKSRIKNVLGWKKPALWVVAAALIVVVCAGAALATDKSGPLMLIDPDFIASFTEFDASCYSVTDRNTIVYTPADRAKDLENPTDPQTLAWEDGIKLVRLINSYDKTVRSHGEFQLDGKEHHFVRMDCADGSFYLVDYWYWNGFSFNPFHAGEDDYTTLVTYFDADGRALTTWQMEYRFDQAYWNWRSLRAAGDSPKPSPFIYQGLTFTMDAAGEEPCVRMDGSVDGMELVRGAFWYPKTVQGGAPYGWLHMIYPAFTDGIDGIVDAGWASESRTSVTLSTKMMASLSSSYAGYWIFTVDLSSGAVTEMIPDSLWPEDVKVQMHPASISDEEAVNAARVAAKLLTAAEDYYNNRTEP